MNGKERYILLPIEAPSLLNLTHMATMDTAAPQMEYQLAYTGGPVSDTSIVQGVLADDQVSRQGRTWRGRYETY